MKVLVTGAGGFVGSHVVDRLLSATDWKIVALVRGETQLYEGIRLRVIRHDMRTPMPFSPWLEDVDAVVNLAASSDVTTFLRNPAQHTVNNVLSTLNLLEWARDRDLRTFIQVSTNEVYGPTELGYHAEWDALVPRTPYSASKACQEMLAIGWFQTYRVPVVVVNTMHLFGERQPRQRFVPTVVDSVLDGKPVPIQKTRDGASVRSWMYVGDFADAIRFILQSKLSFAGPRPIRWNVAGPEMSCLEVARKIGIILKHNFTVVDVESVRPGHDYRYALDTSKFDELEWAPRYGIHAGLTRTVEWLKRKRSSKDET